MGEAVIAGGLCKVPLAIDLCCGKGGWTSGLIAAGYRMIGFDIRRFASYPGELAIADVRTLDGRRMRHADLIVASPPCENFSIYGMPHFHPNPPPPILGLDIFRSVQRICEESGRPYVIENVRDAQRFVGPAVNHLGPFYLWGTAVPAIFPPEFFKFQKGLTFNWPAHKHAIGGSRKLAPGEKRAHAKSADVAMIPEALGKYIGELVRAG